MGFAAGADLVTLPDTRSASAIRDVGDLPIFVPYVCSVSEPVDLPPSFRTHSDKLRSDFARALIERAANSYEGEAGL